MPIAVSSDLVPLNENGFALANARHIKNGFPNLNTLAERDSLPLPVKKVGLILYVVEDDKFYQWNGTVWVEKVLGGTAIDIQEGNNIAIDKTDVVNPIIGLEQMSANSVLGNNTGVVADAVHLTPTQVRALLNTDEIGTARPPTAHTHTESQITDLDKYTQAQTNTLLNAKASTTHASTHESSGSDAIEATTLKATQTPLNYIPSTATIGGHLLGIDTKLGSLSTTTAGVSNRVWFTADTTTIGAGTFFLSGTTKGTLANAQQSVTVNDPTPLEVAFAQDIISAPFTQNTLFAEGSYGGILTVSTAQNNAEQGFKIEVYRATNAGVISGGVLLTLDSGNLTLNVGDLTNVLMTGTLGTDITFLTGERVRYKVYGRKIGTAGGGNTMTVYYGNTRNSYIDTPVPIDTSSVINKSNLIGLTTTQALNTVAIDIPLLYNNNFRNIATNSTVLETDKGKELSFESATVNTSLTIPLGLTTCDYFVVKTKAGITNTIIATAGVTLQNEIGTIVTNVPVTTSQILVFRKLSLNSWAYVLLSTLAVTEKLIFYVNPNTPISNELPVLLPKQLLQTDLTSLEVSSVTYQSRAAGSTLYRNHANLSEVQTAINGDTAGTISRIRVISTFDPAWTTDSQVIIQAK